MNTIRKTNYTFRKGSVAWALYHEDFSDLTLNQIAEVFDVNTRAVGEAMRRIYVTTGKRVKYTKCDRLGRPIGVCEFEGGQCRGSG